MNDTTARYQGALDALVADMRNDPQVIAVILVGSLSHDVVWERSDIDLVVVIVDGKLTAEGVSLLYDNVIVHAGLTTRSAFKKQLGSAVQTSFMHSLLSRGRVLFTRDETLSEFFTGEDPLGARDRRAHLMQVSIEILPVLTKAHKWFTVKKDYRYSFFWITKTVPNLAKIEVISRGGNPGREVIQQALAVNSEFFDLIYTRLTDIPKTEESVGEALRAIDKYLLDRQDLLFGPVLDYLHDIGAARTSSELDFYFASQMNVVCVSAMCEWLSDQGIVERVAIARRLTERSRADVEEAGYYYDRDANATPRKDSNG